MDDSDEGGHLVPVFEASDVEAQIVRAYLEDNGVPAVTFGSGLHAEGDSVERVMVRSADRERALQIIAETEFEEVELGDEWAEGTAGAGSAGDDDYDQETYDDDVGYRSVDPAAVPVLAAPSRKGWIVALAVALAAVGLAVFLVLADAPQ